MQPVEWLIAANPAEQTQDRGGEDNGSIRGNVPQEHSFGGRAETGFTQIASALGYPGFDANSVAEASASVYTATTSSEVRREMVEAAEESAALRRTGRPFWNSVHELGMCDGLLSASGAAFCNAFTHSVNPLATLTDDMRMHPGDPFCEWVFEMGKQVRLLQHIQVPKSTIAVNPALAQSSHDWR